MSRRGKSNVFFLSFAVLAVFLLSACSQINVTGTSSSNLTTLQILQKSAEAMRQLKATHFEFVSDSTVKINQGATTQELGDEPITIPPVSNIKLVGSGDQALPDKQKLNMTINDTVDVQQLYQGENVYVESTDGKWYVVSNETIKDFVGSPFTGNPFAGVQLDQSDLFALLLHIKLTDKGSESLDGQTMRHLTAELDEAAVKFLFSQNPQLRQQLGAENVDAVLDNIKKFASTIDVWISEENFYVYRTEMRLNVSADTSKVQQQVIQAEDVNINFMTFIDLSRFNESFDITVPSDATPIKDLSPILDIQSKLKK